MNTDNVDTRVVELDFDNRQFEKNAKQSMSTLDKLKKSLSFDNVSDSIDQISVSFSKMEVVAITTIQNITNRAVNLGINLLKSLSVDNISSGWVKFGQKTTSVATMAAQSLKEAGRELDSYSEKMAAVDKYLSELNWFSDETSYTFTDMVDNIGKFTAAGQDLDKSVKAMMGIANWAALSGQNAATASRAMYQLSQALSKGYVQLLDYKSIQNANMDTQEFRQTVLDTAVALGELTKSGDNYITKAGKKFTKNQFTEQLSDKWFTDKVLLQSLEKYSSAVEQIYQISEETGLTASEVIEQYGDSLDEFGVKAFRAAQEARTFSDALSSVRDAYSTAWMKTFEIVFGSYDDAKSLWTDLANELYDAIVESNNFRNEVLDVWKELSGRADLFAHTGDGDQGAFWNIYDAIIAVKDIIRQAWDDIFPKSVFSDTSDQATEIGSRLKRLSTDLQKLTRQLMPTEEVLDKIRKILNGVFSVVKFGLNLIKLSWEAIQPIVAIVKNLISMLATLGGKVGAGLSGILEKLTALLEKFVRKLWELSDAIYEKVNIPSFISRIKSLETMIVDTFKKIWNGFKQYISPIISTIKNSVSSVGDFIASIFDGNNDDNKTQNKNLKQARKNKDYPAPSEEVGLSVSTAKALENKVSEFVNSSVILSKISSFLGKIADYISSTVYPLLKSVFNFMEKAIGLASAIIKTIFNALSSLLDLISARLEILLNFESVSLIFYGILDSVANVVTSILILAKSLANIIIRGLNVISGVIKALASKIDTIFSDSEKAVGRLNSFASAMGSMFSSAGKLLTSVVKLLTNVFDVFADAISLLADMIGRIIPSIQATIDGFKNLSTGFRKFLKAAAVVAIIVGGVILIAKFVSDIIWTLTGPIKNIGNSLSDLIDSLTTNKKLRAVTGLINSISILLLSFSVACAMFQTLDPIILITAVSVLTAFVGGMFVLAVVLNKTAGVTSTISTALLRLNTGLQKGKAFKSDKSSNNILMQFSKMITSIGVAMLLVSIAIKNINSAGWDGILKGLAGIGVFFVTVAGVMVSLLASMKIMSSSGIDGGMKGITKPIIAISILALALSSSLSGIAKYDWDKLLASAGALSMVMVTFGSMVTIVSKFGKASRIISFALSISAAVSAMSASLMLLAKYDWDRMLAAAGALSMIIATFGSMVTLITALGGVGVVAVMITFGIAMIEVATASVIFASAMEKMSGVGLGTIGKTLLILAGGIAAFAAASVLISPVIPVMLSLGVALTLLGVGLLATGAGMAELSNTLVPACQIISENIQTITDTFTTMANSIGDMIADVIVHAINNLASMSSDIFGSLTTLLVNIIGTITEAVPQLMELLKNLVIRICQLLDETKSDIIDVVMSIFMTLLGKIEKYAPELFDKLFGILEGFLVQLKGHIPMIVNSLVDILVVIIDSLTKNVGLLVDSIVHFIVGLLKTFVKAVGKVATTIVSTLLNIVGLLIRLLGTSLGTLMGDIILFIGYLLQIFVQAARGMADTIGQTFLTIFAIVVEAIDKTIRNAGTAIRNAFKIICADMYRLLLNAIEDIFGGLSVVKNWVDDQRKGLDNRTSEARQWMSDMASGKNITDAAKKAAGSINDAMSSFNKDISENTKNGIDSINAAFNDFLADQDTEITITPVIDDSELDSINDKIDHTIDYGSTVNSANATNRAVSGTVENKTVKNETTYNNNNQYTSTFNISGNYDPNEIADIVDQRMQSNVKAGRYSKGLA